MASIFLDEEYFPAFEDLPELDTVDERYFTLEGGVLSPHKHWCFMAEVVGVTNMIRVFLTVKDRKGKETLIGFYLDHDEVPDPRIFPVGSTVFILYAEYKMFMDGNLGIRVENGPGVYVLRHSLSDILKAQSVTPGNCQKCGKAASLRCAKCHKASYCSKECQVGDWVAHKKDCVILRQTSKIATKVGVPFVDFNALTDAGDMTTLI